MVKKYFLAIVLVILVGIGLYFLFFRDSRNESNDLAVVSEDKSIIPTSPSEFFVTVDESGNFDPSTINVGRDDKVTWQNESSRNIWPASAFHPTHEIYPEFDAKRGIKPGESYSFVFDRFGSWRYHDHLNASKTGQVIVDGPPTP